MLVRYDSAHPRIRSPWRACGTSPSRPRCRKGLLRADRTGRQVKYEGNPLCRRSTLRAFTSAPSRAIGNGVFIPIEGVASVGPMLTRRSAAWVAPVGTSGTPEGFRLTRVSALSLCSGGKGQLG